MNIINNRQIVLDTETTGMNTIGAHYEGHRIIEIGAVEIINRQLTGKNFHVYLKPNRLVDIKAFNIHGISDNFLSNQPKFNEVAKSFFKYIVNTELIIHNAAFDIGFIDYEFSLLMKKKFKLENFCKITDSLKIARKLFPGKRNSLNALCSRYNINNNKRILHGALLDAEILAQVYLLMTSGQISFSFHQRKSYDKDIDYNKIHKKNKVLNLPIIYAKTNDIEQHIKLLKIIKKTNKNCLWNS
ncbi:DNA polymerase III subunit epsilon [Candidatus Tachikawaea gelatinosa]|uniref:DNA polymerase III subunit epsilon n=1 Tax=Candidatus Tachikawaea gelatinosa TaxID=1410383 RepID=A0A090APX2_9ENTR|nr:DNA polymerase III subunit epsilon [Candidatus Tachikawaea gelatinosa]BAP58337.1 DNA polymerase III epsilon subunit [Candidatus Tachikawaea gelatinosa]